MVVKRYNSRSDEYVILDHHAARDMTGGLNGNAIADRALTDVAVRPDGGRRADFRTRVYEGEAADSRAFADAYIILHLDQSRIVETYLWKSFIECLHADSCSM